MRLCAVVGGFEECVRLYYNNVCMQRELKRSYARRGMEMLTYCMCFQSVCVCMRERVCV